MNIALMLSFTYVHLSFANQGFDQRANREKGKVNVYSKWAAYMPKECSYN